MLLQENMRSEELVENESVFGAMKMDVTNMGRRSSFYDAYSRRRWRIYIRLLLESNGTGCMEEILMNVIIVLALYMEYWWNIEELNDKWDSFTRSYEAN